MPFLSPVGAEILIACVTIIWGIFVETWFVSRWTIFFNIVPMIAMLSVFDTNTEIIQFMGIFLLLSLLAVGVTGRQWLKQLVGAKGYGVIALSAGLVDAKIVAEHDFFWAIFEISCGVLLAWLLVYWIKDQYD